jgi:(p)ppGpp synthase/HD superfamily hydrolase
MTYAIKFLHDRGYPHPEHAQEVLQIILEAGITDPTIHLAALVHDIQDYTSTTNQEVADQFGLIVARITAELFLDLRNPSSNFLTELLNRANTLSTEATTILLADLVFSLKDVHHYKKEKEHYNRNVFAWMREVVSQLNNPNPVLMDRLNSAFDGIYEHFTTYPRNETQQDVWDEMAQIVEGQNNDAA